MATILEMLLGTMTPEEQATIRRKLAENPQILVDDAQAGSLLQIFKNDSIGEPTTTPTTPPTTTTPTSHTPTAPVVTTAAPTTPAAPAADTSAQILAKLTTIETSLTSKIDDLKKNAITSDRIPALREAFLTDAIKISDEINQLRNRNQSELGVPLDQTKFEDFVNKARVEIGKDAAGQPVYRPGYPNLTKAWEAYTQEDRNAKVIATKVDEGVKAKTSAATVPGQSQSTALSPAQEVMRKARENSTNNNKSAAAAAADRLAAAVRAREESTAA